MEGVMSVQFLAPYPLTPVGLLLDIDALTM